MGTPLDMALAKFAEGYNCSQSVLHAHCDELGLDRNTALRLACGLGAGMGRKGEVCGAVSGGVLVLGLRHGRGENDGRSATDTTYAKVRELMDRFQQRHGTVRCRELLGGCDLATPEGQKAFKEKDLFQRVCMPCVETVVRILEEIR